MPETKVPALPDPNTVKDPHLRRVLSAVKEALDIRLGRRGDKLDRAVTVRDLYEGGLADIAGIGVNLNPRGPVKRPPDVFTQAIIPTTPVGLVLSPLFETVFLEWEPPTYKGHSLTEIWRSTQDDLGTAVLVGTTSALVYADTSEFIPNTDYFYWIRFASDTGHTGPYNSTAGTVVQLLPFADQIIAEMEGRITATQLHASLTSRIDLIDGPISLEGSVDWKIQQEATDRANAIAAETQARITAINTETQERNTGLLAEANARSDAIAAERDERLNQYASLDTLIGENRTLIEVETQERVDDYSAIALQASLFLAATNNTAAAVSTLNEVYTDENTAINTQLTLLQASIGGKAEATVVNELSSRVDVTESTAISASNAITALQNSLFEDENGVITVEVQGVLDLSTRVEEVEGDLYGASGLISQFNSTIPTLATTTALNALDTRVSQTETTITAESTRIDQLQASINNDSIVNNSLAFQELTGTVVSLDGQILAEALRIDALLTNVGENTAAITANQTAITDESTARATDVQNINTELSGLTTSKASKTELNEAISEEQLARATALTSLETSLQTDINTRATTTALNEAISTEQLARNTALTTLETALQGDINTRATKTELTEAISSEEQSRISALASLETSLQGDIDTRATTTALNEAISTEQLARSSALTSLETSLQGDIDTRATKIELTEAISSEEDARISAISELSVSFDTVQGSLTEEISLRAAEDEYLYALSRVNAAAVGTVSASDNTISTVMVTENEARITQIEQLYVAVDEVNASIDTVYDVIASETEARATAVTTLQSSIGDQQAAIQQQMETVNGLSAQYTVKIDNNGRVAGYGLASDEGGISDFTILADRFSIFHPSSPNTLAFGVENGNIVMNGNNISDGTITGNKIAVNTITAEKINATNLAAINANLGNITAGRMQSPDGRMVIDLNNRLIRMEF